MNKKCAVRDATWIWIISPFNDLTFEGMKKKTDRYPMNVPKKIAGIVIMVATVGSRIDPWSQLLPSEIHHHICSEAMLSVTTRSHD